MGFLHHPNNVTEVLVVCQIAFVILTDIDRSLPSVVIVMVVEMASMISMNNAMEVRKTTKNLLF
jgi:hypothetical protein